MIAGLVAIIALLAAAVAWLVWLGWRRRARPGGGPIARPEGVNRRILFPFAASDLSRRALDAALRLARAEDAVLVPVFLARVPLHLPLDAPLPRQSGVAIGLQEAIEQRATLFGVPVDARIERGRDYRHAMRQTIAHERFERIVIAAADSDRHGFGPEDVAWLLATAPGEIIVLRPADSDPLARPEGGDHPSGAPGRVSARRPSRTRTTRRAGPRPNERSARS
jgi:nucleotide-binding universal stress UspA family protein